MVVNIAKNIITLSAINDAFSVSFSPNTCVIKADYDGNNPQLNSAYTDVSLKRGEKKAKYELTHKTSSNSSIAYRISSIDEYTKRILLTAIPNNVVSGYLIFDIESDEGYSSTITFQFSVIRESTMLDWIQEWENNKTTIGSTYLITPRIFVGKKVVNEAGLNSLSGVYIGPDATSAGIYGYKEGEDIFHINESGGSIGGWEIDSRGIQSSDRLFKILSEGTIKVENNSGEIIWAIQKAGDATFSKGKVRLNGDGSAYFEGDITSTAGNIGGWSLGENLLHSDYLVLDSSRHYIGISPFNLSTLEEIDNTFNHKSYVEEKGGVCMFYTSANSYGIEGYLPNTSSGETRQIFSLGSANQISGWNMSEKKLASKHVVLVSDDTTSGIYLSTADIDQTSPSNLVGAIENSSGIYLYSTEHEAKFVGMKTSGVVFSLSSTTDSIIAGWKFNDTAIFKGTLTTSGFTQSSGDITISSEGLRGHKWRLDADGNGAIADGEIYWDTDGVHFGENVKLSWNNFSDEAKDEMQNGLLPDWVNDWDKVENKTEIGGEYVISPKLFSGTKNQETNELTGIAIGRDCISINGVTKTGIFAIDNGKIIFELDPMEQKYRFSGTILAQLDENNVWEVDENCIQYVGNKQGRHIEINPATSDISIYDNNNKQVVTFEGNSHNLEDFWGGDISTLITKNIPFVIEGTSGALPIMFSYPLCENIVVSNDTTSLSYQVGIIAEINGNTKNDYFEASFYIYNYSTEPDTTNNNLPTPDIKILLDSVSLKGWHSGSTISDKSSTILPRGYNLIICIGSAQKSNSDLKCTVELFRFPLVLNASSYIANYFANGITIGNKSSNVFSVINNEYKNYNGDVDTALEIHAYNPKAGIKIIDNEVYIKRSEIWGFIPSMIYSGEIHYNYSSIYFTQMNHRSWNGEPLLITKTATGIYDITFPDSWKNAGISDSSCHYLLQQVYPRYENFTIGFIYPRYSPSADLRIEMRSTSNELFNGSFYLEIKHR